MQKYRNTEGNHSCLPAIAQTGLDNSSNRLQDAIPKCLFPTITRLRRFNPVPSTLFVYTPPPSRRPGDDANLTQQMWLLARSHRTRGQEQHCQSHQEPRQWLRDVWRHESRHGLPTTWPFPQRQQLLPTQAPRQQLPGASRTERHLWALPAQANSAPLRTQQPLTAVHCCAAVRHSPGTSAKFCSRGSASNSRSQPQKCTLPRQSVPSSSVLVYVSTILGAREFKTFFDSRKLLHSVNF